MAQPNPADQNQPVDGRWARVHPWVTAVALLATVVALGAGLYAAFSGRDNIVAGMTMLVGLAGVLVTGAQSWPGLRRHLTGAWRAVGFLLVSALAVGSGAATWVVWQTPVIKIAVSMPFLANDPQDAIAVLRGVRLAVTAERENRIGTYDIELVPFDDTAVDGGITYVDLDGKPLRHVGSLRDLTDDAQVAGIIGPFNSGTMIQEIGAASSARIPLISPSTTVGCLSDRGKPCGTVTIPVDSTFLRIATTDAVRAKALVTHLAGRMSQLAGPPPARTAGARAVDPDRVVMVSDGSLFGAGLAGELERQWKEAGTRRGRAYRYETVKVENAAEIILKRQPGPGVVIFSGTGSESIGLYGKLQEDDRLGDLIFAGPATIMSNGFSVGLQSGIRGSLYAVTPVPFDDSTQGITDFKALFQAQYTDPNPTPYSAAAYDATRALIISVRAAIADGAWPAAVSHGPFVGSVARTLREATLAKLLALNRGAGGPRYRQAATGTFSFTDKGDADYGGSAPPTTIYRYLDAKTARRLKEPRTGWRVSRLH